MKKIIPFVFTLLLPVAASAYDACIDKVYYNFVDDKAIVTYKDFDPRQGSFTPGHEGGHRFARFRHLQRQNI